MDDPGFVILYSENILKTSWKQGISERKRELLAMNLDHRPQVLDTKNELTTFPKAIEVEPKSKVAELLVHLSPDTPRDNRQIAIPKKGNKGSSESLPMLFAALQVETCCIFTLDFSLISLIDSPVVLSWHEPLERRKTSGSNRKT
jgi:hypothetical protein